MTLILLWSYLKIKSRDLSWQVKKLELLDAAIDKTWLLDIKNPTWSRVFLRVAHSRGFEPLTARFVAEYSIQLSYECFVQWRVPLRSRILWIALVRVKSIWRLFWIILAHAARLLDLFAFWTESRRHIVIHAQQNVIHGQQKHFVRHSWLVPETYP